VIEEKTPYYAYGEIEEYISQFLEIKNKIGKSELLSFRLVNYFKPEKILEIGSGCGINTLFLTAPSRNVKCLCFEQSVEKYTLAERLYKNWDRDIILFTDRLPDTGYKQDCIYIGLDNYKAEKGCLNSLINNYVKDHTYIIVKGIRTNDSNHVLWRSLMHSDRVTISLDLFNTGILFFDPKLYKRNYRISF